MKKCTILFISFLLLSFSANAQITVDTVTGYVGIATTTPDRLLEVYRGNIQVVQENLILKAYSSSAAGDVIFYSSTDSELARLFTGSSLYIRGNHGGYGGIRMNLSNENVGIQAFGSATYELQVGGDALATGSWDESDKRLKTNITNLSSNKIDNIKLLSAFTYNLDQDEYINRHYIVSNQDSIQFDIEKIKEERKDFFNQERIGFLAQDVRLIYPELVKEDEFGYLAINYIGFIPIIVEALNEQKIIIDNQTNLINALDNRISELETSSLLKSNKLKSNTASIIEEVTSSNMLYQNIPNPFNQNTEIKYFIENTAQKADLYVYNLQGIQINSYSISDRDNSSLVINSSELQAGTYLYTLIVDGQEVDTKKMILTQ